MGCLLQTYVVDVHPFNPRIAMSAGYDGRIIIWDVSAFSLFFSQVSCCFYQPNAYSKLNDRYGKAGQFVCMKRVIFGSLMGAFLRMFPCYNMNFQCLSQSKDKLQD